MVMIVCTLHARVWDFVHFWYGCKYIMWKIKTLLLWTYTVYRHTHQSEGEFIFMIFKEFIFWSQAFKLLKQFIFRRWSSPEDDHLLKMNCFNNLKAWDWKINSLKIININSPSSWINQGVKQSSTTHQSVNLRLWGIHSLGLFVGSRTSWPFIRRFWPLFESCPWTR